MSDALDLRPSCDERCFTDKFSGNAVRCALDPVQRWMAHRTEPIHRSAMIKTVYTSGNLLYNPYNLGHVLPGMHQLTRVKGPGEMALDLIRKEYPNYHPLVSLARLAHNEEVKADPRLEAEIHKTILPYVQPKLSNVEVKVEQNDARRVVVTLFEDVEVKPGLSVQAEVPLVTDVIDLVPLDN